MAGPRIVSEVEIPDHQQPAPPSEMAAASDTVRSIAPPPRPQPQPRQQPGNLAMVYHAIATVIGARLMSLIFVAAMVVLSYMAVSEPMPLRLWAAGGFDAFALLGLWLLNGRA